MRTLGTLLILGAVLVTGTALVRGFYYAPNNEVESDSGLHVTSRTSDASPTANALPERLLIPKIGVDAQVVHLGVTRSGNMAAPKTFPDVGWYKYGTVPGDLGSAVIAGHETNAVSGPAIFYELEKLEVGDEISVVGETGKSLRFKVVKKEVHPYNLAGPKLEEIFNAKGKVRLNLITCTGEWLPAAKTNDRRLVVYTELVK